MCPSFSFSELTPQKKKKELQTEVNSVFLKLHKNYMGYGGINCQTMDTYFAF